MYLKKVNKWEKLKKYQNTLKKVLQLKDTLKIQINFKKSKILNQNNIGK